MNLPGVLFIAAFTTRSQAYAQRMFHEGIHPSDVLLFGAVDLGKPGQSNHVVGDHVIDRLFLPDSSKPLTETVGKFQSAIVSLPNNSINDPQIAQEVVRRNPKLVIYSGYGGQIVSKKILGLGAPFLHIHSGWLPDYRGSTTVYYSILQERWCGVSAILIEPTIDSGMVVGRQKFPLPPAGVDIDHLYDGAIRADLLVRVLKEWSVAGMFPHVEQQHTEGGTEYYVIHPVLKHLAMLSLCA